VLCVQCRHLSQEAQLLLRTACAGCVGLARDGRVRDFVAGTGVTGERPIVWKHAHLEISPPYRPAVLDLAHLTKHARQRHDQATLGVVERHTVWASENHAFAPFPLDFPPSTGFASADMAVSLAVFSACSASAA
jgi:hypothetical protein